ncbi:ABC transporter ATP-binding protein [Sporomusa aerivorans]|uniref:ABC transporter ATP-binding protein n=1 Tax=Sporomusa aerivorans TaxID=204936 RepID=UPI00352A1F22
MGKAIIQLAGIKIYRNRRPVLDIDNMTVTAGEMVALAGANGAGKSTLLQVINMLLPYQQGTLTLFGQDAAKYGRENARFYSAMMFQETLLVRGTVYDNVALPLKFRGCPDSQIAEKVTAALATFRCQHLARRQANQLSGGEAQRVGLARAIVYQPQLLLLDEPFAALDAASRTAILSDLRQVAMQNKLTVLLVSHNFNDVLYFAERVVVLEGGRIVQDECPEAVLRRPATQAVANLVDMDNILPCQVECSGSSVMIRLPGGIEFSKNAPAPARPSACCLPGDAIYILNQSPMRECRPFITLNGTISAITPGIGAYKVSIKSSCLALTLRAPREQTSGLSLGDNIEVGFNPDEIQLV